MARLREWVRTGEPSDDQYWTGKLAFVNEVLFQVARVEYAPANLHWFAAEYYYARVCKGQAPSTSHARTFLRTLMEVLSASPTPEPIRHHFCGLDHTWHGAREFGYGGFDRHIYKEVVCTCGRVHRKRKANFRGEG